MCVQPSVRVCYSTGNRLARQSLRSVPSICFHSSLCSRCTTQKSGRVLSCVHGTHQSFASLTSTLTCHRRSVRRIITYLVSQRGSCFLRRQSLQPLHRGSVTTSARLDATAIDHIYHRHCILFRKQVCPLRSFLTATCPSSARNDISSGIVVRGVTTLVTDRSGDRPCSSRSLSRYLTLSSQVSITQQAMAGLQRGLGVPGDHVHQL